MAWEMNSEIICMPTLMFSGIYSQKVEPMITIVAKSYI